MGLGFRGLGFKGFRFTEVCLYHDNKSPQNPGPKAKIAL